MTRNRTVHANGLPHPQRLLALAAVVLAVTMAVLDGSIVNVALPSLAREFAVSPAQAIGVVTAYQLATVVSLLPLAALAEAIGFRKVYLSGIVLFAGASVLAAEAPSLEVLVAARLIQGLGAAAVMSINSALVRHIVPPERFGWGIGWMAATVGVSAAAGPTLAAAILSVASWHWLFLINVPLSALAFGLGIISLPYTEQHVDRFDGLSAVLNVLAFGGLISALSSIGAHAPVALVLLQLAVALASGVVLTLRQASRTSPLLPIDLLERRPFARAMGASVLAFTAQFVAVVSLPFYLHDVLGYSAVHTGLLLTAWPLATAIVAPMAGRWADRSPAAPLTTVGLLIFAAGLLLPTALPGAPGLAVPITALLLAGAGFGLFQAPNNRVLLTTAPRERSGAASGLQSTARLLGQSTGAALAAILMGAGAHFALRPVMWTAAGFAAVAAGLSALGGPVRPVQPSAGARAPVANGPA